MENHPIPQDVTGFKFKLIGSMTVKQFLYLLGFGILATVVFALPQWNFMFVKVPLIVLLSGIGLSLAFVPIDGRPMDTMIMNFAKTIPSENRYIFKKRGANIASFKIFDAPVIRHTPQQAPQKTPAAQERSDTSDKRALLLSRLRNSSFRPDEAETNKLKNINSIFENDKSPIVFVAPEPQAKEEIEIIEKIEEPKIQKTETVEPKPAPKIVEADKEPASTSVKVLEVEREKPTSNLGTKGSADESSKDPEGITVNATAPSKQYIPSTNLKGGFPSLPDIPNVVMGQVLDPRGKVLQGMLVEVIDSTNTPVRAFKTNALGQFSAATPLPNGTYKLIFEDSQKQHEFAPIDITLEGQIFIPVEAVSTDDREKLRRELFGAPGVAGAAATA